LTEQLDPSAVGNYDQFLNVGGATKVASISPPDDDGTTCIREYHLNYRQSFTLAASAIPAGSTINSVTVHSRLATSEGAAGDYVKTFIRLGGADVDSAAHHVFPTFDHWTDFDDALSRPGGGSWDLADLASLEIGVAVAMPSSWADCTTIYAVIDYTPGGGPTPTGAMLLLF
jgi:hypothetical protein